MEEESSSRAPICPGESTATAETERPDHESAGAPDAEAASSAPVTSDASGTESARGGTDDETPPLLTDDEERGYRDRWQDIQSRFVDDPREAVHDADALAADVMQTLATAFALHKKDLEGTWSQGQRVDTEELRGALRRYRSFLNRLLST
ncbi:hypothetical protein AQI88_15860 [Streptomyces cellostaticus]|uniref:Uncharacterized protein n=1 Tax=Streptomyces cellostaticus TaxID=67285 RepID=A0A124HCU9_9ACTN|nr:hypothetical protein [Streptomyces cellostaticus]KUM95556.1 hypothetical protein AQI88_15860 [Streptomyces cellostaticus]GHI09870.1 hypothetical protein Scel_81910 [Streptomyces cellostaticus]